MYRKWSDEERRRFAEDWNGGRPREELIERWGYDDPRQIAWYLRRRYRLPLIHRTRWSHKESPHARLRH